MLAGSQPGEAEAGAGVAVPAGGGGVAPVALPLEILPAGDFEPLYRLPLDVRSGELPVLPLSIYGAGGAGPGMEGWLEGIEGGTTGAVAGPPQQHAGQCTLEECGHAGHPSCSVLSCISKEPGQSTSQDSCLLKVWIQYVCAHVHPGLRWAVAHAVAMAHLPDGDGNGGGYVSGSQWFIYLFDRQQVG